MRELDESQQRALDMSALHREKQSMAKLGLIHRSEFRGLPIEKLIDEILDKKPDLAMSLSSGEWLFIDHIKQCVEIDG